MLAHIFNRSEPTRLRSGSVLNAISFNAESVDEHLSLAELRPTDTIHYGDKPVLRALDDIQQGMPLDTTTLADVAPPDATKEQADARVQYFPLQLPVDALDEHLPDWKEVEKPVVVTFRNNISKIITKKRGDEWRVRVCRKGNVLYLGKWFGRHFPSEPIGPKFENDRVQDAIVLKFQGVLGGE